MPHQLDERNFDSPFETQPFRFEKNVEDDSTRKYFTSVDTQYLAFGLGQLIHLYMARTLSADECPF
jgi:hypothetical protein